MANVLYPSFKQSLLSGGVDLTSVTVKAILLDADYTYNAAHDMYDDVAAGSRVGTAQTLGSKTVTSGVFDAADITFTNVTNATDVVAVLLFVDTGVESTSKLIAYLDTGVGLDYTTDDGNITVSWSNGASKIFAL